MAETEHECGAYARAEHACGAYADGAGGACVGCGCADCVDGADGGYEAHVGGGYVGCADDADGDGVGCVDDDYVASVGVGCGCVGYGDDANAASSMWACQASCTVRYSSLASLCSSRSQMVPNGSSMSSWSMSKCKLPVGALGYASRCCSLCLRSGR